MRAAISRLLVSAAILAGFVLLGLHLVSVAAATPQRPAQVAASMLANPAGRAAVSSGLTPLLAAAAPGLAPAQVRAAVDAVTNDPNTAAALNHYADADTDAARAGALRAALAPMAAADPAAAAALNAALASHQQAHPGQDPLTALVPAPAAASLARYHQLAQQGAGIAALAALTLAGLGLVLGPGRARLLRRMGRAALVASAGQLLVLWAAPTYLLPRLDSPWASVAAAGLDAAALGLVGIFFALALLGAALLASGWALSLLSPVGSARELPKPIRGLSAARARARSAARRAGRSRRDLRPAGHSEEGRLT